MESFAFYLLKSAVWLTAFTLVYLLFLRNERFFRLKRAYLVAGVIMSLFLPLITLHYRVELPAPVISQAQSEVISQAVQPATMAVQHEKTDFLLLFLCIYAGGVILCIGRTLLHLVPLYRAVKVTAVHKMGDVKLIRSEKYTSAFSFFNYVFINPSVSEQEAREILNHEMVHLKQKHWFDLLLVELVGLVQWINPFAWIYSAFVRQNHENLADEEALKCTSDPANYRATLLNQVFSTKMMSLSNSFNFSFYTNRFEMMKKRAFSPYRKLKLLLVVPLMAVISYAFATPRYAFAEPSTASELTINQPEAIIQKNVKGVVYREDGTPFMGVSVNLSGTTLTAITDAAGRFEFKGIPENVILLFTYKGYKYLPLDPVFDKEMSVKMTPVPNYVDRSIIKPDQSKKSLPDKANRRDIFVVVEEMPEYPGGDLALLNNIIENLTYPPEAKEQGIQGKVILRFVVTAEGKVDDISVVRGVHPLLDAEAIRVMSNVSDWIPGRQGGKPVDVYYSVPISFTLK